jgi:PAS domain S-box-containing protein
MAALNKSISPLQGGDCQPHTTANSVSIQNVQHNRSEELLKQSEERYLDLIELCADGVFLVRQARIVAANRAAAELFGCTGIDDIIGRPLADLFNSQDPAGLNERVRCAAEKSECLEFIEYTLQRPDGSSIDTEITVTSYPEKSRQAGRLMVMHDVTERNRIAKAMQEHGQYVRLITDAVPALIAYVDIDERYRFVNATYEQWFGRPRTEIIGKSLSEVMGVDYPQMREHIAGVLQGEHATFEQTVCIDGVQRHIMGVCTPDKTEGGVLRGFSVVVMDITERRNGEQTLREREKQLRLITDAVPVFIAQCDSDYHLKFVNRTYADRFGYRPEELIGKRIPDLMSKQAFARIRPYLDAALAGSPQEQEVEVSSGQTGQRNMHMVYMPEHDENGAVHGLIAAVSDITRLRSMEEQLHRREREFKTLVENSPDIISRIDRNMRHLYVNPAIESLADVPASAYLGKTKAELGLPPAVVQAWDMAAQAAFDTGIEQRLDFDHTIDGRMRYFSGRVIPEVDRDGNIESVVGIAYDVTGRAKMEKERDELLARERTARIQAETAARARDEFLAIVSHELRAPLNGIQSWAHILENYVRDSTSAPLAQRALQGIKTGVGQQVRLIEDLLDVTRMMSGKLRLVKQPLALLPVIQAAVESVRGIAAAKHISITCTYRVTTEQIEGDSDRVQQIFWNLLSNAVKFTPENGNVWLTATHSDNQICITIRDDGVGISREFLPHLFNRFSQEDTSSTRGHSGLGLGLFLVRHLVELHGGRVTAESEGEGKGTTFTVYLPLRARNDKYIPAVHGEQGGEDSMPLPSLGGYNVLLIDDQEEARESLTVVLANAGAKVFAAESAKDVLDWLATLSPDAYPNVLVCDIAMPGEDGYAVLRRIRGWKSASGCAPLKRLPALALTAFAQREDRIKALTAGFQMHVTKPVAPEELIIVISTLAARG